MNLLEHQAKQLFTKYEIKVPEGLLVRSPDETKEFVLRVGFPVVLKAQVPVGGRGKVRAIVRVDDLSQLSTAFDNLLQTTIKGIRVESVLAEKFIPHERELYLSIALNRSERSFVLIASGQGGVDVEEMGEKVIHKLGVEPPTHDMVRSVGSRLNLSQGALENFAKMTMNLSNLSFSAEAELVEVNPLALLADDKLVALDAKVIIDDNALFRHRELEEFVSLRGLEAEASKQGFSFVELDGSIAVVGNGAGLVLSTLDLVKAMSGDPACFLDLGGGATSDRVYSALVLLSKFPRAKRILMNVFGGITKCDEVAQAIRRVYEEGVMNRPMYVRLSGSHEEEARRVLMGIPVKVFDDVEAAIRQLMLENVW